MSADPQRWLSSDEATDLERDLLRSWEGERPPAGARERTLAALGIAAPAAAVAAAGGSVAPKALGATWLAMTKWVGLAVLAVGLSAAGVVALHGGTARPAVHEVAPVRSAVQRVAPPATPATVVVAPAPQDTASGAVAPAPARAVSRSLPVAHAPRPVASSLADQVAALDRAHAALDTGDAGRSLSLVDDYEARYPDGAFLQEAEALRVESLVRQGSRAEAERVGRRFLAAYPRSPHAPRIRELLGYAP